MEKSAGSGQSTFNVQRMDKGAKNGQSAEIVLHQMDESAENRQSSESVQKKEETEEYGQSAANVLKRNKSAERRGKMSFHLLDLPDLALIQILSSIPHVELIGVIGKVCRRLAALSQDGTLWRDVYISLWNNCHKRTYHDNEHLLLSQLTRLRTLSLARVDNLDLLVTKALEKSPGLSKLELHSCYISNNFFFILDEKGLLVKKLILRYCDPSGVTFSSYGQAFSRLTHLELCYCNNLLDCHELLVYLADHCPTLCHLDIREVKDSLIDEAFAYLLKKRCRTLRSLTVYGYMLSDNSIRHLALCLQLEELCLYSSKRVGWVGLLVIPQLAGLKKLEILNGVQLSYFDSKVTFGNGCLKNLQRLTLYVWNHLSDQGVKEIAQNCPRLTHISLGLDLQGELTHGGIAHLLRHCPDLCQLKLWLCQGVDLTQLPLSLLTGLRRLDLDGSAPNHEHFLPKLAQVLGPDTVVRGNSPAPVGHSSLSAYMKFCGEQKCRVQQRYLDQWHLLGRAELGDPLAPTPKALSESEEKRKARDLAKVECGRIYKEADRHRQSWKDALVWVMLAVIPFICFIIFVHTLFFQK